MGKGGEEKEKKVFTPSFSLLLSLLDFRILILISGSWPLKGV